MNGNEDDSEPYSTVDKVVICSNAFEKWVEKLNNLEPTDCNFEDEGFTKFLDCWGHNFITTSYSGGSISIKLFVQKEADMVRIKHLKEYHN